VNPAAPSAAPPAPAGARAAVRVRVERLVLDGFDLSPADRARVGAAARAELARLIAEGGVHPELAGGGARPRLRAPAVVDAGAPPAELGAQIARAVYGGIGR